MSSALLDRAENMTIASLINDAASRFGAEEAVVAGTKRATYAQLDSSSDAIARALVASGIGKGDHVGICVGNSVEWVELFYGIAKAGAVSVPINTRLRSDEIRYQLHQAQIKLLFLTDRLLSIDFLDLFSAIANGMQKGFPQADLPHLNEVVLLGERRSLHCTSLSDFLNAGESHELPLQPEPNDSALIQFTSGTTSLPKGAVLGHSSLVRNARSVAHRMGISKGDRYLSARPFFHVAGTTLSILLSATVGATLVTMNRFVAKDAVNLADVENCSYFSGNDTLFLMLLDESDAQAKCRFKGGWAAASAPIMKRAMEELGAKALVSAYGLSEASPNVAISDWSDDEADRIAGWMRPHPGLQIRIVAAETGNECAFGEPGEIHVHGWSVMQSYFNLPHETEQVISADGFLKTGDIGIMREDGRIRFIGRLKEIIRVGGENVSPSEIEDVLLTHPDVAQVQVVGVPDPRLIEVPAAYIILKQQRESDIYDIQAWAKLKLAGFKFPKYFAFVPTFENLGMTASGKVQKKQLAQDALSRFCNSREDQST